MSVGSEASLGAWSNSTCVGQEMRLVVARNKEDGWTVGNEDESRSCTVR
jgi:hypothetical protein